MKLAKIFFCIGFENKISNEIKFYSFVPYKFGPYSFELFHDVELLENENIVITDNNSINFSRGNILISNDISKLIDPFFKRFSNVDDKELIDYVYEKYPEYTIFSEIKKREDYVRDRTGIYTIGYEGLSIDEFLMRLIKEKIQYLVDVRDNPWSMKYGFTKHNLEMLCEKMSIQYRSISSLGVPSNLREKLNSKKDYENVFKAYVRSLKDQKEKLENLRTLSQNNRIALMCFEKNPEFCHRRILAEELEKLGAEVEIH